MNELLALVIGGGIFTFLGVIITLFFTRKKVQADIDLARAQIKKLEEEAERLNLENQNMRIGQMNAVMKEKNDLEKDKEELKAKLYIANEEKLLLAQQLQNDKIEKQKALADLSERQKVIEELLKNQHQDIVEIKKVQTGQLPSQLPGAMEHKNGS